MKSRHIAREIALQFLYRQDVSDASRTEVITPVIRQLDISKIQRELENHFSHFNITGEVRDFASALVLGTLQNTSQLDLLLEKHASNWKVERMGFIDRNLLRMSAYELNHFSDIPPAVTLHEAVELAKQFGTAETPAFVNGILDAIHQEKLAGLSPKKGEAQDDNSG